MTTVRQFHVHAFALAVTLLATCPVAADEAAVTIAGVVTVNDKPLADGVIIFYLKNDEFVGTKIKGGNYKVTRVPPGEWRVTMRSDEVPAKNAVEFKVAVKVGMNVLDFDLKKN